MGEVDRDREMSFHIIIVLRTIPFNLITPLNHAITSVVILQNVGWGKEGITDPPPPPEDPSTSFKVGRD
jgi:hypothetical protein